MHTISVFEALEPGSLWMQIPTFPARKSKPSHTLDANSFIGLRSRGGAAKLRLCSLGCNCTTFRFSKLYPKDKLIM